MSRIRLCKGSEWQCIKGHTLFPKGPCPDEASKYKQGERRDSARCTSCRHFKTIIYVP